MKKRDKNNSSKIDSEKEFNRNEQENDYQEPDQSSETKTKEKELVEKITEITSENARLISEINKFKEENSNLKENTLRLLSDIKRIQDEQDRNLSNSKKSERKKIILQLLPQIESFKECLNFFSTSSNDEVKNVLKGVAMLSRSFKGLLENFGVNVYPVKINEDIWNSDFFQVISQVENDVQEEGTITKVIRDCYLLDGTMISPGLVVTSKKTKKT